MFYDIVLVRAKQGREHRSLASLFTVSTISPADYAFS